MNEPLRPSTLGEILDRTAQLYRSRFLLFLGISVVPTVVAVALICVFGLITALWNTSLSVDITVSEANVLTVLLFICIFFIALPVYLTALALASAAISHAVSRVHLGQTTTIRDAYKSVWRKGWRYIGLYLLRILFIGVIPVAGWIALVLLAAGASALAQTAGMESVAGGVFFALIAISVVVALIGYFLWMLCRLSLAFPACVVEQIGAWPAVKRSSFLSKGTKGRIFVLYLLGAALTWLLSMGIMLLLAFILALLFNAENSRNAHAIDLAIVFIYYGSSFAVQALVQPVYGIALVLFYYDQRIRVEGFDIEWLMQQAGMADAPASAPHVAPPTTPRLRADPTNPFAPATEPPQAVEFPQDNDST